MKRCSGSGVAAGEGEALGSPEGAVGGGVDNGGGGAGGGDEGCRGEEVGVGTGGDGGELGSVWGDIGAVSTGGDVVGVGVKRSELGDSTVPEVGCWGEVGVWGGGSLVELLIGGGSGSVSGVAIWAAAGSVRGGLLRGGGAAIAPTSDSGIAITAIAAGEITSRLLCQYVLIHHRLPMCSTVAVIVLIDQTYRGVRGASDHTIQKVPVN